MTRGILLYLEIFKLTFALKFTTSLLYGSYVVIMTRGCFLYQETRQVHTFVIFHDCYDTARNKHSTLDFSCSGPLKFITNHSKPHSTK
ncbi:hypothetical protein HAX54_043943, partial [Datura stramonium]|nr:hypothetical protein [Datura stramonium]